MTSSNPSHFPKALSLKCVSIWLVGDCCKYELWEIPNSWLGSEPCSWGYPRSVVASLVSRRDVPGPRRQPRFTLFLLAGTDQPGMLCSFRIPGAWSCAWSLNVQANNCFSTGEPWPPPWVSSTELHRPEDHNQQVLFPRLPASLVSESCFLVSTRFVSEGPVD